MNVPENLQYTRTDEWVRQEGDEIVVGITDYAQHELGEIVYVELPAVGASVTAGASFGVVESVKAVSELISPLSGTVVAVNEPLADNPALINESPYGEGWMIRVQPAETASLEALLDAATYAAHRSDH